MSRSVSRIDLTPLMLNGSFALPAATVASSIASERLSATVLRGKQLFHDARDPRLSRDSYMSCASCHSDGGHDGRTWDLTGHGEGLRNTASLRGRAGLGQGRLHWTQNFDEVQDFETQIRTLAGGTGLWAWPRPARAPTSMRWRPTWLRSTPLPRARRAAPPAR